MIALPEQVIYGYETFSESGIVYLVVGLAILILSNALAYLIIKSFNLKAYYGRFLGGIIILFVTLLLSLSTNQAFKFKSSALFGIGEIVIGGLDVINNSLKTQLPILIPDPGCSP